MRPHKVPGYASVTLLAQADRHRRPATQPTRRWTTSPIWADEFSLGEIRVSHEQNLILANVKKRDLYTVWESAKAGRFRDVEHRPADGHHRVPGRRFLLAREREVDSDRAVAIQERFSDLDYVYDLGDLTLNISGCINACGHHHIGNIGVLGVDKDGSEWYQVTLGGEQSTGATGAHLGRVIGPSFSAEEMPDVVSQVIDTFVENRAEGERFIEHVQPHRHRAVQGIACTRRANRRTRKRAKDLIEEFADGFDYQEPRRW